MIKRLAFKLLLAVAVIFSVSSMAWAQTPSPAIQDTASGTVTTPSTTDTTTIRDELKAEHETEQAAVAAAVAAKKSDNLADRLKKIIAVGDQAIVVRNKALEVLSARLTTGNCSSIDATLKTTLLADITTLKNNLTSEKTALDAATTVTAARSIVQNIYVTNRVFMRFIPAANGACVAQRILDVITNKITPQLTVLKNAGIDITALQAAISNAQAQATAALALFEKVAANPGDANTSAATDLKTAVADLASAKMAIGQVRDEFAKSVQDYKDKNPTAGS